MSLFTYSFQNLLRQDYRQKKALYTVVYFVGGRTFKTSMPDNVFNQGICKYINYFQKPIITLEDVNQIIDLLDKHMTETTITSHDCINL